MLSNLTVHWTWYKTCLISWAQTAIWGDLTTSSLNPFELIMMILKPEKTLSRSLRKALNDLLVTDFPKIQFSKSVSKDDIKNIHFR